MTTFGTMYSPTIGRWVMVTTAMLSSIPLSARTRSVAKV